MSSTNPTATKKKMAGRPNQFEDAEEETDELLSNKTEASAEETPVGEESPSSSDEAEEKAPTEPQETKDDDATKEDDATENDDATMKDSDSKDDKKEEDKKEGDKEEATKKETPSEAKEVSEAPSEDKSSEKADSSFPPAAKSPEDKPERPLTTPDPPEDDKKKVKKEEPSTGSPLDALASMALAAEQPKPKKKKKQEELPPPPPIKEPTIPFKGAPPTKFLKTEGPKQMEGTRVRAEDISCTDVLCGRGGQSNHHPGNIFFRRLVRAKQEEYLKANKREKTVVAKDIVKLIRLLSPGGRFLKKDPKDENVYVDVGDTQARNKASQALREGAPELREELRDQHSRMNAERGGGPEVKLPYHGSGRSNAASEMKKEADGAVARSAHAAAAAAAHHGMFLPAFAAADARAAAALRARGEGNNESSDDPNAEDGADPSRSAAAVHAAAEERARRLMLASMGQPGLGPPFFSPHFGLGGLGGLGAMNPFLAQHTSAAQLQAAAALQAAGGSHLLSPQALMMAAAAQQPSAAALLHASRARDLANHIDAANYAAATGINPLLLHEQQRAAAGGLPFSDSMRLHDIVKTSGNANADGESSNHKTSDNKKKRERDEIERGESDEKFTKAAKLSRQYR